MEFAYICNNGHTFKTVGKSSFCPKCRAAGGSIVNCKEINKDGEEAYFVGVQDQPEQPAKTETTTENINPPSVANFDAAPDPLVGLNTPPVL